ncbi:MAG: phosphoglucosamine mutase [Oscillospiraceae bacterium]|jgi:phosphoglucosamine mutase|nr:phosphoglucosamine mutase [Oscillospiraceae bacterium]
MGRLFGTDGARGIANTELTCELAVRIGRACGAQSLRGGNFWPAGTRQQFIIGMDTRASSGMLANALAAGFNSVGVDAVMAGVVPTPAVAHLIPLWGCAGGAMVSASHNPCEYNGIKLFGSQGTKLPDAQEERIEAIILDETEPPSTLLGGRVGRCIAGEAAVPDYLRHLRGTVPGNLATLLQSQGMGRIALDCANGSASVTAPRLFSELGFAYDLLSAAPDGENINKNCGSTHMEALRDYVRAHDEICAGFAFDGDADRLLAVDETGALVNGDQMIALCAKQMQADGHLKDNAAVATVMANLGFHAFCERNGIAREITTVGDRYVLERMQEKGLSIGGEQSGHIIFSEFAATGDGQLTALQVLNVMRKTGRRLSALAGEMEIFPQVMVNVKVSNLGKLRCHTDPEIALAVVRAKEELGESGRVLVRVSGTEPLIRVMLEGRDAAQIRRLCNELAEVVRVRLI